MSIDNEAKTITWMEVQSNRCNAQLKFIICYWDVLQMCINYFVKTLSKIFTLISDVHHGSWKIYTFFCLQVTCKKPKKQLLFHKQIRKATMFTSISKFEKPPSEHQFLQLDKVVVDFRDIWTLCFNYKILNKILIILVERNRLYIEKLSTSKLIKVLWKICLYKNKKYVKDRFFFFALHQCMNTYKA